MDKNKNCTAFNIKSNEDNYIKKTTVCRTCYDEKEGKNNNNTLIQNQQPNIDNVNTQNSNGTLIIGFSTCGKSYLMKFLLVQTRKPFPKITNSQNQNRNIKAQTADEIKPLEKHEKSLLFLIACWHQNKPATSICFLQEDGTIVLFYTIYLKAIFLSQKIQFVIFLIYFFQQILRDIIPLFHDRGGLDMKLQDWKQLCRRAWQNDYDYLRIDSFAEIGEARYTIRNCNKTSFIEVISEKKTF